MLVWAGMTLKPDDEPPHEKPTLAMDVTRFQPTRGVLVADLINSGDEPIYIDDIGLYRGDSLSNPKRKFTERDWAHAAVVDESIAGSSTQMHVDQWPGAGPLRVVGVSGGGGRAVLGVSVDPPCGDRGLPTSAHVVIWYHTQTGNFTQRIPDLLNAGSATELRQMTRAVCRHERLHSSLKVQPELGGSGVGRHWIKVDDVRFSYRVPAGGWERFGSVSLNKSLVGPQGAEGIVYWTAYPDGAYTDWCDRLTSLGRGASNGELADAIASAPGTEVVDGPWSDTLDGQPTKRVVLKIRDNRGCDPGYFYSWNDPLGGALWPETIRGDTISVWIVNVEQTQLFIAAETHKFTGPRSGFEPRRRVQTSFRREVQGIVESIRFGKSQ